jgi:ABC-type multidrug transport system fused ATPase/permease subunit
MDKKTSDRKYIVSRAVEEPLEATFELGEDIQDISTKLTKPLTIGIFGNILLILLLLPSIYFLFLFLISIYYGTVDLSTTLVFSVIGLTLILAFFISILITVIIYFYQIYKFNSSLLQRYSLVSELKKVPPRSEKPKSKVDDIDTPLKKDATGKHLKNPIFATIDLVEEYMHELPQLVKLIRFSIFLVFIVILFLVFAATVKLAFGWELLFVMGVIELGFGIVAVILLIPNIKYLIDSEGLISYLRVRHDIIDSIRFGKDHLVPKGKDQLTRLTNYLTENDPYIKSSTQAQNFKFDKNVTLKGASGKDHEFDAVFKGANILKDGSVGLGMPMGGFGVFIRKFEGEISNKSLQEFRDAVIDVCKKDDILPLRVMALQLDIQDLQDDVYYFAIDKPILMKNTLTHIQITAEDGKVYSFIPMVSYGKDIG